MFCVGCSWHVRFVLSVGGSDVRAAFPLASTKGGLSKSFFGMASVYTVRDLVGLWMKHSMIFLLIVRDDTT